MRQAEAEKAGNRNFSHFGPENNLFAELEQLFSRYGETGTGKRRKYLHNADEAAPYKQEPGTFTPWEDLPADTQLLFYEGLHGAVVTPAGEHRTPPRPADRRGAGDQPRMDPEAAGATSSSAATRLKPSPTRSCAACPTT